MLNHICIAGRLTKNPEMRRTQNDTAVTSFTLAVDRDFTGKDGNRECDFINCVAWRKTAEFCNNYFTKGQMAVVSGRLEMRKFTDKDGNNRTAAEVNVDNIYFGGNKSDNQSENTGTFAPPSAENFAPIEADDEQLPF